MQNNTSNQTANPQGSKTIYKTCVPNGGLIYVARRKNTLPGFCEFGAYADLHPDDSIQVLAVGTARECYKVANSVARKRIRAEVKCSPGSKWYL